MVPLGKNVIKFGVDMSSSAHIDNKKRDIWVLGKGRTQGLDDSTLTAEAKYSMWTLQWKEQLLIY